MAMRRDSSRMRMFTWSVIAGALIAFGSGRAVEAETGAAADVATPVVATPIAPPNPVLGADDKIHLVYEIVLMNMAPSAVAIERIETLDAESGAVIGTLDGDGLAKMMRLNGGGKGTDLAGGRLGLRVHGRDAREGRRRPEGRATPFRHRRGEGSQARRGGRSRPRT